MTCMNRAVPPTGSRRNAQAGVSIIVVLMAVAFMGILILMLGQSFSQSLLFRRVVAASEAYRDVEGSFQTLLASAVRDQFDAAKGGACAGAGVTIGSQALGADGVTMGMATEPPSLPTGSPADMQQAAQRCRSSGFRAMGPSKDLYFCLLFRGTGSKAVANTTFAGAALAFAEVEARLLDLSSGTALSCGAYQQLLAAAQPGAATIEVTYSIYWYTGTGTGANQPASVFKRRNGIYYTSPL